jgi:hypothetical protein
MRAALHLGGAVAAAERKRDLSKRLHAERKSQPAGAPA